MLLQRWDENYTFQTQLDPIEDILTFISTFRSLGNTKELLRGTHGFTKRSEIVNTAKLVSLHIQTAINLAQQAFEGPAHVSFLPLYYATLNLTKVHLLMLGKRFELQKNRWHGAIYNESEMTRYFLNEKILIKKNGTIPLIYNSISGNTIPKEGLSISLKEIYEKIYAISAEYTAITNLDLQLFPHCSEIVRDDSNGHYLEISILEEANPTPPSPRKLKAYTGINSTPSSATTGPFRDPWQPRYTTKKVQGDFDQVQQVLKAKVKRYLIHDIVDRNNNWISLTPLTGKKHVFSEELYIMLAYFHLSNIVRYNPEHMSNLMDSKYWAILLGLRKHGFLNFIKLMYGNYVKKSFDCF